MVNPSAVKMTLWQAPSGRLHLHPSCSGGTSKARITKVKVTKEQFEQARTEDKICRCLRRWRSDEERVQRGRRLR